MAAINALAAFEVSEACNKVLPVQHRADRLSRTTGLRVADAILVSSRTYDAVVDLKHVSTVDLSVA